MRLCILISCAVMVLGQPASAETIDEYHGSALEALDVCKRTWFQSRRKDALIEIMQAGRGIATRLNPISKTYETDGQKLDDVIAAGRTCKTIVYPE